MPQGAITSPRGVVYVVAIARDRGTCVTEDSPPEIRRQGFANDLFGKQAAQHPSGLLVNLHPLGQQIGGHFITGRINNRH